MGHIKNLHTLIGLSFLLLAISCTNSLENSVTIVLEGEYPTLLIRKLNGENISIAPNNNTGSIAYVKDNKTVWLKGLPRIDESSDNKIIYSWASENNSSVKLTIRKENKDLNFNFELEQSESPATNWIINIKAAENEFFTGIFERVVDGPQNESWANNIKTALNLRGEKVEVKLKYTVSAYSPFYVSSENYGLFVKGTWPGIIDFCKKDKEFVHISFEGPQFNIKFYTSENPIEIVRKHALETGPSIVLPKWAFGPWRWRDQHFNKTTYYDETPKHAPFNTDIVEDVLMMQALDIPTTAHWIDRPWAKGTHGFEDYEFDTLEFPNPEGMIKWLNNKNQELMIWIAPYVIGDMANWAEENNYYLESKTWFNSGQVLMDFTNPEAIKWWGENGPGKLAKMGIKGFKLDRADGEKLIDSLNLYTYSGTTYRENYNDFPHQYVKATYEVVQPILGNDFVLFPRAQYTGSSKYGAMWAGDTDGKPEGLRSAIIGMQRCAIMGYPNWGSDIGGYWGSFSRETAMRWIAFGCFSPIMETGPTNNLAFWSNPNKPFYDIELIATWRLYSKIRMSLIDYISELSVKANKDGTPIIMPLFLKYPNQEEAWNDWQTYLFGPDILVSAIWNNVAKEHELYLPKGEIWIDAWNTDKEYEGGRYIKVDAPLYKIPLFIRKGSRINMGKLMDIYTESLKIVSIKPDLAELEKKEGWD